MKDTEPAARLDAVGFPAQIGIVHPIQGHDRSAPRTTAATLYRHRLKSRNARLRFVANQVFRS